MVALGVLGILVYPVGITAVVTWATCHYEAFVSSSHGLAMLRAYSWLFGRFQPEQYYMACSTSSGVVPHTDARDLSRPTHRAGAHAQLRAVDHQLHPDPPLAVALLARQPRGRLHELGSAAGAVRRRISCAKW